MYKTLINRRKKRFVIITSMILVLILLISGCGKKEKEDVIKIGAILPLTGNISEYGIGCKEGIDLALDNINSTTINFDVIYEDNEGKTKNTISSLQKLITTDIKFVIGPVASSSALSIIPIINREKILLFSPTASSPELTGSSKLFLRTWPSDNLEGNVLAEYAKQKLELNVFGIIYLDNDYGKGLMKAFDERFTKEGGDIVKIEGFLRDRTDFKSIITQFNNLELDGVYIVGYHKELIRLTKQLRELEFSGQIIASANFETPEVIESLDKIAEGVIYGTPTVDTTTTQYFNFKKDFRKKYNKKPDIFSANSYDIMRLLSLSLKENNYKTEHLEIANIIKNQGIYYGVSGKMKFSKNSNVFKPIDIKTVKDGKFIKIETYVPSIIKD